MAISKLNTIFTKHHRIIFGVFAVLIILAFVLADWIGGGGSLFGSKSPADQNAAVVLGKSFTEQDLYDRQRQLYLTVGQVNNDLVQQQTLQMAALDVLAERNRIAVSEEEVNKTIVEMFQDKDGKFQEEIYRRFIDKNLKQQGFTEDDFVAAIRQNLVRQKLLEVIAGNVVVTDDECRNFYNLMNHRIESVSCTIKIDDYKKQIKVDEKALQQFFAANRKNYVIPAKLSAEVVKFSYEDFAKDVKITDDEAKKFYDANKAYLQPVKGKDGKDVMPTFEQVKAKVTDTLKNQKAVELAHAAAGNFSRDAYDQVKDQTDALKIFKSFVAGKNLKTVATGKFSADSAKAGTINSSVLVQKLAAVAATDVKLSEVIEDNGVFYVGFLTEYIPARQAEYKEVTSQVRDAYIAAEAGKLALKRAEEIIADLQKLAPAARKAQAEKKYKFTAKPAISLQQLEGMKMQVAFLVQNNISPAYVQSFLAEIAKQQMLFDLKAGDITSALPNMEGFEVTLVTARKGAEKPYTPSEEFTKMVKQSKANQALTAMLDYCNTNTQVMVKNNEQEAAK